MDHQSDVLVVDATDAGLVERLLRDHAPGLSVTRREEARELGLVRWQLEGVDAAVAGWPGEHVGQADPPAGPPAVDRLVGLLRDWGSSSYPGWSPELEVDHLVDFTLDPHIKVAVGPPTEVPAPEVPFVAGAPDGPRVGIADARVHTHPDLVGHLDADPEIGSGPFESAACGHATMVAGTVLQRAPHSVLVCRDVARHGVPNRPWEVAQRLLTFLDEDVAVLNMSFGFLTPDGPPLALSRALGRLAEHCVLVAAVGNQGADDPLLPMYPGALPYVVGVGAAATAAGIAPWAPQVPWLDLEAPGVDVVGPFLVGDVAAPDVTGSFTTGFVTWSGSSFAAAYVTGELARLMYDDHVDAATARQMLLDGRPQVQGVTRFEYDVTRPAKQ